MVAPDDTIPKDDRLALLIATGAAMEEAARACGMSRRTAYRRLDCAEFRAKVQDFRQALTSQAVGQLISLYTRHISNLDKLGHDPGAQAGARVSASKAIIELGAKLRAELDLEQRVRALEERLAQQGQAVQP